MKEGSKGFSIFSRLLVSFLGAVVVISTALTAIFYVYTTRSLKRQAIENIQQQFEALDYRLRFQLQKELLNNLRVLSSNPLLDEFIMSSELEKEINARGVERLFLESMKYIPGYHTVVFADARGRETIKVDRTGRVKQYRDVSRNELFLKVRAGQPGGVHFEAPRSDARGGTGFSIAVHKTDNDIGKFGGAVTVAYSLDELFDHLAGIRILGENPLWIFDSRGNVLKQPAADRARLDPRPYLSAALQPEPRLVLSDRALLIYRDFMLLPGRPLLRTAISVPPSLLLQDVEKVLRFFFIVFAASLFLMSLAASYLAKYLSRPIIELAQTAAHIASSGLFVPARVRAAGEVRMLVDSFNEMTEKLRATTVSRDYVDNILNSMMDLLIVLSPEGAVLRANRAACALLGYAEQDLRGMALTALIRDDPGAGGGVLSEVLGSGSVSAREFGCLARDGRKIPVLFSASLMRDARGEARGLSAWPRT